MFKKRKKNNTEVVRSRGFAIRAPIDCFVFDSIVTLCVLQLRARITNLR